MFSLDFYIDSFQSTKRVITNQVFTDPKLNKAANKFIDAQTQFAKMLAQNTVDMLKYSTDSFTNKAFPKATKND
jgi:hypothetical protein